MKAAFALAAALLLGACSMDEAPRADPDLVAATQDSRATPLPNERLMCKADAPVCCAHASAAATSPTQGHCVATPDQCAKMGGTVSTAGIDGCV
ncbi:MAG TPA: hypothetical protein VD929_06695 [Caulobacteraceae bacterium]|nr:hypothetical protein [Caulobacteraceae bacterium]